MVTKAQELLTDTAESILNASGTTDLCHLAAIEKIKILLCQVVRNTADDVTDDHVVKALPLVELARFTLVVGPDAFEDDELLDYGLAIAEVLQAAQARLEHPPAE